MEFIFVGLVRPPQQTQTNNIHTNRNSVDNAQSHKLAFHFFQVDNKNGRAEKVKVPDKKNQPDAFERALPKRVFPYKMISEI